MWLDRPKEASCSQAGQDLRWKYKYTAVATAPSSSTPMPTSKGLLMIVWSGTEVGAVVGGGCGTRVAGAAAICAGVEA